MLLGRRHDTGQSDTTVQCLFLLCFKPVTGTDIFKLRISVCRENCTGLDCDYYIFNLVCGYCQQAFDTFEILRTKNCVAFCVNTIVVSFFC